MMEMKDLIQQLKDKNALLKAQKGKSKKFTVFLVQISNLRILSSSLCLCMVCGEFDEQIFF